MILLLAAVLFGGFGLNIVLGAFAGATFLTSPQEMLLLAAAVIVFVVAALRSEAARRSKDPT